MDTTTKMATYPRHGHLVTAFFPNVVDLFKRKELYHLQEEQILVFRGKKYSGEETLVDVDNLENKEVFITDVIDTLDFIQPDFLFFKKNKFLQSHNTLKTAGTPDLVVEVWSANNEQAEREMKYRVYSSSDKTEHWYLEQDSNIVQCFVGKEELRPQSLKEVLFTLDKIQFDLRHLAV